MSGSEGTNPGSDGDLQANRFDIDLSDELLQEVTADTLDEDLRKAAEAEHYSELVARQWGTPEGEWWP